MPTKLTFSSQATRALDAAVQFDIDVVFSTEKLENGIAHFSSKKRELVFGPQTQEEHVWHELIHALQFTLNDEKPIGLPPTAKGIQEYIPRKRVYDKQYKETWKAWHELELEAYSQQGNQEIREAIIACFEEWSLEPLQPFIVEADYALAVEAIEKTVTKLEKKEANSKKAIWWREKLEPIVYGSIIAAVIQLGIGFYQNQTSANEVHHDQGVEILR